MVLVARTISNCSFILHLKSTDELGLSTLVPPLRFSHVVVPRLSVAEPAGLVPVRASENHKNFTTDLPPLNRLCHYHLRALGPVGKRNTAAQYRQCKDCTHHRALLALAVVRLLEEGDDELLLVDEKVARVFALGA